MSTFTHAVSTNNYGPAKFIVDSSAANGTHTTIASALTAASSGDTIFIRPGTYTENLTLKAGVHLAAYLGDEINPSVTILGKCSYSGAGNTTISGIRLKTNSDYFLQLSGSSGSIVYLESCYLDVNNNSGMNINGGTGAIYCRYCFGDTATTGITYFVMTGGSLNVDYCQWLNTGASTTASTMGAQQVTFTYSTMNCPLSVTSGIGNFQIFHSELNQSGTNTTCITTAGSGNSKIIHSFLTSGTASAISIGAGTIVDIRNCSIQSTNANAIAGSGTLNIAGIFFDGSSSTIQGTITQADLVFNSGTIITNTTAYAVICGGTTSGSVVQPVASVGSSGQVLTSNGSGALPSFQNSSMSTVSTGSNVTNMTVNTRYVLTNGASTLTLGLPTTSAVGDAIQIVSAGANASSRWQITQAASQQVHNVSSSSTSGATGTTTSNERYDTITIVCVVANNEWTTISVTGTITFA
jgi:hypothetical protein